MKTEEERQLEEKLPAPLIKSPLSSNNSPSTKYRDSDDDDNEEETKPQFDEEEQQGKQTLEQGGQSDSSIRFMPALLAHLQRNLDPTVDKNVSKSEHMIRKHQHLFKLVLNVNSLGYLTDRIQLFIDILSTVQKPEHREQLMLHTLQGFPEKDFETIKSLISMVPKLKILPSPPKYSKMNSRIDLRVFEGLKSLEICDVEPKWITQLQILRPFLHKLTVTNGVSKLSELLSTCWTTKGTSPSLWKSLRILRVSHNQIEVLDDSLALLPVVEMIDLSHNKIKKIEFFQDCYNLRRLDLSFNLIEDLSGVKECIGNVTELVLRHNSIQLVDGLEKLPSLERLDLSYNQIGSVESMKSLSELPLLRELWLEMNPLAYKNGYRLIVQRLYKKSSNATVENILLDGKPLSSNSDGVEIPQSTLSRIDSFTSMRALQKKTKHVKEKVRIKPKLAHIDVASKIRTAVSSEPRIQVNSSVQVLVSHVEALKKDVGDKWLSVMTEEMSQKSRKLGSSSSESRQKDKSGTSIDADELKDIEEILLEHQTASRNSSGNSSPSPSNPHRESKEKSAVSALTSPVDDDGTDELMNEKQWVVSVLDHRRVLTFVDDVAVERDLARGRIMTEYRLLDIKSFAYEGKTLTLTFHNGKIATYAVEDPLNMVEICEHIKQHIVSEEMYSGPKSPEEHPSAIWSPGETSTVLIDDDIKSGLPAHKVLVIISDYFQPGKESKSDVSVGKSPSLSALIAESDVVSQFIEQYRSRHLPDFEHVHQIGILDYKRKRVERESVLVLYGDRLYIFDKHDLESETSFYVVLVNQSIFDIVSVVFGLFMRCMRFDFKDENSFLILTREKEKSSAIIKLILGATSSKKTVVPPSISNRDRETLDAIAAQVLKGAAEDIRLYELLFDSDAKDSGGGKWGINRTVVITDQRLFLCYEDHQKWASGASGPLFSVIASEKRSEFSSVDSKEFKYSGKFSITFGTKRGFAAVESKRKWNFYTPDDNIVTRIIDELHRKTS